MGNQRILITGSCGLVGTALTTALQRRGDDIRQLDIAATGDDFGDVRSPSRVARAIDGCDGVVHLAAISRVVTAQMHPDLCRDTNIRGLHNVLEAAAGARSRPWVIFASSREVYGQAIRLPADEDTPLCPVNTYGRSKLAGERLIVRARRDAGRACTVRLSNVYGSVHDHPDRVIPAFVRGAVKDGQLRVEGGANTFDFTHVDDVAAGLVALVDLLTSNEPAPPPIHLVSGIPTTLQALAEKAVRIANSSATICSAPPRNYDVAHFVGRGDRAEHLLGWRPTVSLEQGLERLANDYRELLLKEAS